MDMSHGSTGGTDCKVSMLWNWYTTDACFLSPSWQITNNGTFAATCIGVILLVIVLEFLRRVGKEYDALILRQFQRHVAAQRAIASPPKAEPGSADAGPTTCCGPPPVEAEERGQAPLGPVTFTFRASPLQQLIRAVIHAVTFGIAYLIMLLVMYFNGYIFISIVIGAGIGKFVCDWMVHKVIVGVEGSNDGPTGIEETTVCCG